VALLPDCMADLEDIRALSARYARGLDRFAMDELLEPFAGDAVFDAGQYLTIVIDLSSEATALRRRDCLLPPAEAARHDTSCSRDLAD
jgi:SnoaL-like domain